MIPTPTRSVGSRPGKPAGRSRVARVIGALFLAVFLVTCSGSTDSTTTAPGNDAVTQAVGPAGGTVVTPSGAAGVQVPAGTFSQQVMVTITRLPTPSSPGAGPLPSSLKQYGPYYDFTTSPQVAQFGDSARVGVCQVTNPSSAFYPPEPHDRLRLAHTVGTSIEILDRVGVNDFLRCTNVSASWSTPSTDRNGLRGVLLAIRDAAIGPLRPASLYAAHGGLGGKVKSFSPFGAVDQAVATVAVTLASPTVTVGSSVQATAVLKDADGNVLTGHLVTWTSSNTALATVTAAGVVTGVAAGGPVTITATSDGQSGTTGVTVVDPVPVISSVVRELLGNPLLDPLPLTELPRGGRYSVVVTGSTLSRVNGVSFSNALVTATIRSVSATSVTMVVTTPFVEEGNTAAAPLGPVAFIFSTSNGVSIPSQGVTLSIVEGPSPIVSRLVVTNGVTRLKAGVSTVVTFEGDATDAGNGRFAFITSQGVGTFQPGTANFQGQWIQPFTMVFTPPDANSIQSVTFGVVDGAGHKAFLQLSFPVDP
jgi:Bacterial Ig-like domain (group 2)